MRKLTAAVFVVTASLALTTGQASAHPGHTSCKDFGQHNAIEAHDQIVDDEVRFFGPGNVDDVVALVHIGGTFGGETVPALCTPA